LDSLSFFERPNTEVLNRIQRNTVANAFPMNLLTYLYYTIRPAIPRNIQIALRRQYARHLASKMAHVWPINSDAGTPPKWWNGWPDGRKFALVLSHDVDTQRGHHRVMQLAELEKKLGFRSCFNFVPERYKNSDSLHKILRQKGFEIAVHGLKHDGKLFSTKKVFENRAVSINHYLNLWETTGFTSPSMHHQLAWMARLNIEYSISTFDTDPFEPQPDGATTIFPFLVQSKDKSSAFVELPYTLPQDFTLFVLLQEKDNQTWKKKLDWIAEKGGMALLNTHTDYMNFEGGRNAVEEYSVDLYLDFIQYVKHKYAQSFWHALPVDVARHVRQAYTG